MSDTSILKEKLGFKLREYQYEIERLKLIAERKTNAKKEASAHVAIEDLSTLVDEAQTELSKLTEARWKASRSRLTMIWEQLRVSCHDARNEVL